MLARLKQLGPGLMLAAVAVGVSHLVFSTQAGADYGFSLVWLIVLISLLKYPAFRFAVDYASATGNSLVPAYAKISRIAVAWLILGFIGDMFAGTAAVAVVTAGLLISVFDLPLSAPQVGVGLMVVSALVLINGQYLRAERLVRILVVIFSILALIATVLAIPKLGDGGRALFAELTPTRGLAVFMIAMAGWMPIPTNGAVLISAWVREKRLAAGDDYDSNAARRDFRIGFALTIMLAMCFVTLGTAILFQSGRSAPSSAGGFATELLSVFTNVIGSWAWPLIAATAIAVMWSTLIALMDVMPRVTDRLFAILGQRPDDAPSRFAWLLAVQVVGVSIILMLFMGSFASFLTFATSFGFLAAPAVAWYNYVAASSADMPDHLRPGRFITIWNAIAIVAMVVFALGFITTTFF